MDYKSFIKKVPTETKELVHNGIDIYMVIMNKKIGYQDNQELVFLNEKDKKCLSLFLSGLITKSNVKTIMLSNNVNNECFYKLLDIKNNDFKKDLTIDYEKAYNQFFQSLIDNMADDFNIHFGNRSTYRLDNFMAGNIIDALIIKDISGSDIIKRLFIKNQLLNNDTQIGYHPLFIELQKENYKRYRQQKEKESANELFSLYLEEISSYGEFLSNKKGLSFFDHKNELEALMISLLSTKRGALLISDDACEKDVVVNDLLYLIYKKQVPSRLQDICIFKLNTTSFISDTAFRGELEKKVKTLAEKIISNKNERIVIYVDNIYQTLSYSGNETSLSLWSLLMPYMDRIKIIGGISKQEYLRSLTDNNEVKSKFAVININEPTVSEIELAIVKTIDCFIKEKKINFSFSISQINEIASLIAECTQSKHQTYNDKETNPTLAISVIEDAFNYAIIDNSKEVELIHLIKAINQKERINKSARSNCIFQLRQFIGIPIIEKEKIIMFPGRPKKDN